MIFQYILDQALTAPGRKGRIFLKMRYVLLHYHDPIVHYELNGKRIALNFSHQLPFTRKSVPTYATNLTRLSSLVRREFGELTMIDVGANIGDSYCLAHGGADDRYLLIEGDPHYFRLLNRNTAGNPGVVRVQALLADQCVTSHDRLVLSDGTGRIEKDNRASHSVSYRTLDTVVQEHPRFKSANLLKCDVDGFDSKVLLGGKDLLTSSTPVIIFEHHPHLLAMAGDDDRYIFRHLKHWGYSHLLFYDIYGFFFGLVPADDEKLIQDLVLYAKSKVDLCYDVVCFHDTHARLRDQFERAERVFYDDIISGSLTVNASVV